EPEATEEFSLKRQAEHAPDTESRSRGEQLSDEAVSDLLPPHGRVDGDRTDLSQVLPHHVQRAATNDFAVAGHRDPKLLNRLEERDRRLGQQAALDRVRVDKTPYAPDVSRGGSSDRDSHVTRLSN